MIEASSDITELTKALHGAQGSVHGVPKDGKNPHFKNRYATLESVIDAAKPALQANGLAFTQAPGALVDGALEVTTMLMHVSGQWLRSTLHVPLAKRDPQGVGSAVTYGCRYALMATLGIPPVDDDGEAASRPEPPQRPVARPEVTPPTKAPSGGVLAYTSMAKTSLMNAGSVEDIENWWRDEADHRAQHGIVKGTAEYGFLLKQCADRKAAILQESGVLV